MFNFGILRVGHQYSKQVTIWFARGTDFSMRSFYRNSNENARCYCGRGKHVAPFWHRAEVG